ncbi:MAG: hypothetical protein NVS1B7_4430 [Candidatus Saccharimonadales bacterium]
MVIERTSDNIKDTFMENSSEQYGPDHHHELASSEDIATLIHLASDLIFPAEETTHWQTSYELDTGETILMNSCAYEADAAEGTHVSLSLIDQQETVKLYLTFDNRNQLSALGYTSDSAPQEAGDIAAALLSVGGVDEDTEAILLRLLQIARQADGRSQDYISLLSHSSRLPSGEEIAEVTRRIIANQTNSSMAIKNYGLSLNDREVLYLNQHIIYGEIDIIDIDDTLPKLQIMYEDRIRQLGYIFNLNQDSSHRLWITLTEDCDEVNDPQHIDEQTIEDSGTDQPRHVDIQFLIDRIIDSSLYDNDLSKLQ